MSDGWWWLESWLTAMALSKSHWEKWQNKQNKWLVAVLVASLNFVHVFKTTGGIWWVAAGQLSNRGMQAGSVVGIFVCVCSQSIQNKTVWHFAGGHVVVQNWFRHQKWRRAWTTVCVMHKQEMRWGCLGMTWCECCQFELDSKSMWLIVVLQWFDGWISWHCGMLLLQWQKNCCVTATENANSAETWRDAIWRCQAKDPHRWRSVAFVLKCCPNNGIQFGSNLESSSSSRKLLGKLTFQGGSHGKAEEFSSHLS